MKFEPEMIDASGTLTIEVIERAMTKIRNQSGHPNQQVPLPHGYTYAECCQWLAEQLGVAK